MPISKAKAGIKERSANSLPKRLLPPASALSYTTNRGRFIFAFIIKVSIACPWHAVRLFKCRAEEAGTNLIVELAHDGYWRPGELRLAGAIGGTSIAAVSVFFQNQTRIRLYYQAMNLTLREHCNDGYGWSVGQFVSPSQAHSLDSSSPKANSTLV